MSICIRCGASYPYHYLRCSSCGYPHPRKFEIMAEEARKRLEAEKKKVSA